MQLDMKMSLGNIITIGVLVVSVATTFVTVRAQVNTMQDEIRRMQAASIERTQRFDVITSAYEQRIRAVEIAQASQSSRLEAIQIGINDIKDQLRRLTEGN